MKVMIDEKKIEEAAGKIMSKQFYSFFENIKDYRSQSKKDFKAGIDWFLDNLWHDASEKPEAFVYILAETEEFHKGYKVLMFHGGDPWEKLVKYNGISRWLYIDDLMKGGK